MLGKAQKIIYEWVPACHTKKIYGKLEIIPKSYPEKNIPYDGTAACLKQLKQLAYRDFTHIYLLPQYLYSIHVYIYISEYTSEAFDMRNLKKLRCGLSVYVNKLQGIRACSCRFWSSRKKGGQKQNAE